MCDPTAVISPLTYLPYLLLLAIAAMTGPWIAMMQWRISLGDPSMSLASTLLGVKFIPIALCYGEMTSILSYAVGDVVFTNTAWGEHRNATALPFYMTMLSDGAKDKGDTFDVLDLAEVLTKQTVVDAAPPASAAEAEVAE